MCEVQRYREAGANVLEAKAYISVPLFDRLLADACNGYRSIVRSLSDVMDDGKFFYKHCTTALQHRGPAALVCRISETIKPHKDAGKVVPRALHCNTQHPFSPAFKYVP